MAPVRVVLLSIFSAGDEWVYRVQRTLAKSTLGSLSKLKVDV